MKRKWPQDWINWQRIDKDKQRNSSMEELVMTNKWKKFTNYLIQENERFQYVLVYQYSWFLKHSDI